MNGESRVEPLVLTRHFKAPPERIFAAFTEKALMQTWYGPESMTVPHCEVDARVGGKYRVEMHAPSGTAHIVTGEFKEIDAPRRLVFSWGWLNGNGRLPETLVTLTFTPRDGGTDLELVQTGFLHEARRDGHRGGWNSTLNSLDAALEGKPKPVAPVPTLFGDYRSSYLRAARIAFAEKGIACGLKTCAPHSPDILAHHPWGKMPALKVGEESLYETSAILRYVDEAYPGPALMPAEPLARARAEQFISAFKAYVYPAFASDYVLQYLFPRGADGAPDRAVIDSALPRIDKSLGVLEAAYGERDFLVGETATLADMLYAPSVAYLGLFPEGKAMLSRRRAVQRAHEVFAARPSYQQATLAPA